LSSGIKIGKMKLAQKKRGLTTTAVATERMSLKEICVF
jgi:hypothetical protein